MRCFIGETDFHITQPTVVTIGKFDGRHAGHQKLLHRLLEWKAERGLRTAVFTFDLSPAVRLEGLTHRVITTEEERRAGMEELGIDYLVEYPFTEQVSHMPAETFVREILVGRMNAKAIVAGTDCSFGYQRRGGAELLRQMAKELGYEVEIIEKARDGARDISSSYIKEELDKGHMEKVCELLGQPYSFCGTVIHGNHIGGPKLHHPTANLIPPEEKYLPPFGVYVSRVRLDGRYFGGVTNIGRKPTVEGHWPVGVETNLLDWEGDLYGRVIRVELLNYERSEQKFASLEELDKQLKRDEAYARSWLESLENSGGNSTEKAAKTAAETAAKTESGWLDKKKCLC